MKKNFLMMSVVAMAGLACLATSAFGVSYNRVGNYSYVQPGGGSGGPGHAGILNDIYGGSFTSSGPAGIYNYTNGKVTATRVADYGSTMQFYGGEVNSGDQIWGGATMGMALADVAARARYAGYQQSFGYYDGESGGTYHEMIDITGDGVNVEGEAINLALDTLGDTWRWGRVGSWDPNANPHWSTMADNPDGFDHMVTYKVEGLQGVRPGETVWLLFWEDVNGSQADWDYNDLVIEVTASVPEPLTLLAVTASVVGLGGYLRKRTRDGHVAA